jgi:hypothetical protein
VPSAKVWLTGALLKSPAGVPAGALPRDSVSVAGAGAVRLAEKVSTVADAGVAAKPSAIAAAPRQRLSMYAMSGEPCLICSENGLVSALLDAVRGSVLRNPYGEQLKLQRARLYPTGHFIHVSRLARPAGCRWQHFIRPGRGKTLRHARDLAIALSIRFAADSREQPAGIAVAPHDDPGGAWSAKVASLAKALRPALAPTSPASV